MARGRATSGQGVVEYGLILTGSVLVAFVTVVVLGPVLAEVIAWIIRVIEAASGGS